MGVTEKNLACFLAASSKADWRASRWKSCGRRSEEGVRRKSRSARRHLAHQHQHFACLPSPQRRRERQRRWLACVVKHAGARSLCLPCCSLRLLLPTLLPLRLKDTRAPCYQPAAPAWALLLSPRRPLLLCLLACPCRHPPALPHCALRALLCFAFSPPPPPPRPPPCSPGLTLAAADKVPRSHSTAVATLHRPSTRRYGAIGPRS